LGKAFVTGQTPSTNFPTTSGADHTSNAGDIDAFVTCLSSSGSLVYSLCRGTASPARQGGL
jgi:hypothetical protein